MTRNLGNVQHRTQFLQLITFVIITYPRQTVSLIAVHITMAGQLMPSSAETYGFLFCPDKDVML